MLCTIFLRSFIKVSNPNKKVTWYKDGKEIVSNDHFQIVSDGCDHTLVFKDIVLDDQAQYTAKVGEENTSAAVWVEGQKGN